MKLAVAGRLPDRDQIFVRVVREARERARRPDRQRADQG
jgi:hypothetical protein